ncbi:hypothetical protein B0H14DRAFT_2596586 [Mycena olivaceomarginata]|nr:hypothetical protein B0H14DRAFT_2596586 [Mycena olivaceomarginata]
MPRQPSATEDHMKNIIACLKLAIALLQEVQDAFATLFVQAILNPTISLATAIQNVKKNKDKCIQLTEHIHQVLYALVDLHVKSETPGSLPPSYTRSHWKIHGVWSLRDYAQDVYLHRSPGRKQDQELLPAKRKYLLAQDCQTGMQHALWCLGWGIESGTPIVSNIREMQMTAEKLQEELLDLISSFSCGTTSDRASSDYVRVSIRGAGGMGKSSLEPLSSRNSVEELYLCLPDINNLALLLLDLRTLQITMWGAERPAKVRWNRPFLSPLEPLYQLKLRRKIFMDIADDVHTRKRLTSSSTN